MKARGRKRFSVTLLVFKLVRKPLATWICIVPRQPWRSLFPHLSPCWVWSIFSAASLPHTGSFLSLSPVLRTDAARAVLRCPRGMQISHHQRRAQPSIQTQPMTHPTLGFSERAREGQTATTSTNKGWGLTSLFPLWKFQLSSQQQGTFKLGPCFKMPSSLFCPWSHPQPRGGFGKPTDHLLPGTKIGFSKLVFLLKEVFKKFATHKTPMNWHFLLTQKQVFSRYLYF